MRAPRPIFAFCEEPLFTTHVWSSRGSRKEPPMACDPRGRWADCPTAFSEQRVVSCVAHSTWPLFVREKAMVFVLALVSLAFVSPALAQDGQHGQDHEKWHAQFYDKLIRKDTKTSCCNLADCRPTASRMVDKLRSEGGRRVDVGPARRDSERGGPGRGRACLRSAAVRRQQGCHLLRGAAAGRLSTLRLCLRPVLVIAGFDPAIHSSSHNSCERDGCPNQAQA
jgi:hypothetical protein